MTFDYDLFVIGAGSGGLAASRRAAAYGARVAITEQDTVDTYVFAFAAQMGYEGSDVVSAESGASKSKRFRPRRLRG
jgi:flavin-dependent dehydrogenase